MTKNEQGALRKAIATHLDTRDKRYMFLKISFPELVSRIQLEGASEYCAWNIYEEFSKQQMLGSLIVHMNSVFDLQLTLTHKR